MNTFTVYDLKNKLVAFSGAFQNIAYVFTDYNSNLLYVLCRDGKVRMKTEKKEKENKVKKKRSGKYLNKTTEKRRESEEVPSFYFTPLWV